MTLPLDNPDQLVFLPLGGSGEIGMNLNLFFTGGKWIMVDLGVNFAGDAYPGIDLILPDPEFIEDRREDLLALILTHGHEDHIGAVPFIWPQLRCPIYATPFTAKLVEGKLAEHGLLEEAEITIIGPNDPLEIGPFTVTYLPIAHSIAEGNALLIDTPYGRVYHTGDWKLDEGPEIGEPTAPAELSRLGDDGIVALIGDSTNALNPEASGSEAAVADALLDLVSSLKGRVVIATFASNVARLQSVGRVATATGRHLAAVGRSMHRIIEAARSTGYLKDFPPLVEEEHIKDLPSDRLLILATGCQGEPRAALSRIATGDFRHVALGRGDTVVFSSKIIPGNEKSIGRLVNDLTELGPDVITEKDRFVHVSGHPGQPELRRMYEWIRPEIAIPVHGEVRHMVTHAKLARECGVPRGLVPQNGMAIRLAPDGPEIIDDVPAGRLVVDGKIIEAEFSEALVGRRRVAFNGALAVTLPVGGEGDLIADPVMIATGVPGLTPGSEFEGEILDVIDNCFNRLKPKDRLQDALIEEAVRIAARRRLREATGKKPITTVRVARVEGA